MEVFGNLEGLKGAIEKRYSLEIKKIEKDKEKQLAEIGRELNKKIGLLKSKMKTETDAEVKKAHSMILSSENLKAKKEFEEKREALIDSVFKKAEKKAKKIAHSDEYLDYVKKNAPKEEGFGIVGDNAYYKKAFQGLKVEKSMVGIKFASEGLVYDFTLDNMIESKKEILRHEISRVLFS